jgi:lycopene beta-cyclase
VAFDFISSIVAYTISEGIALPQSVTPLFGEPDSYLFIEKPKNQGDVAAKNEARKMMAESKLEMDIPVPFEVETTKVKEVAKL